jgi:hypothetical protein
VKTIRDGFETHTLTFAGPAGPVLVIDLKRRRVTVPEGVELTRAVCEATKMARAACKVIDVFIRECKGSGL